ncbi:MAG TPA: GNAT family N-acetyltransferase [Candidatus Limnocylindrales bacterium]|nr:GNAT family N-acetyltransferase [Candidatus Limnocylindrales bacterium]
MARRSPGARPAPSEATGPGPIIEIHDDPDHSRYRLTVDGQRAGYVTYARQLGEVTFIHTVIRPAYAGRGLGQRLAAFVLDEARAGGRRVRPQCPYIAAYIERHGSYRDLIADPAIDQV